MRTVSAYRYLAFGALLIGIATANCAFAQGASAQGRKSTPAKSLPATAQSAKAAANAPMQVTLVRLDQPGCEPDCAEWIAAQGRITEATPRRFERILRKLGKRQLPILIESRGGSVPDALKIGRMIRARGLAIAVTKTEFAPCKLSSQECRKLAAGGIRLGRPKALVSVCASSCAFLFAGGVRRYVGRWTVVGVHDIQTLSTLVRMKRYYRIERRPTWNGQVKTRKVLLKQETISRTTEIAPTTHATYEKLETYFAEMGVSREVMNMVYLTPHTAIHWLKIAELKSTGLATDFINGEQLLLAAAAPPPLPGTGQVGWPGLAGNPVVKAGDSWCVPSIENLYRCAKPAQTAAGPVGPSDVANLAGPAAKSPDALAVPAIAAKPTPKPSSSAPAAVAKAAGKQKLAATQPSNGTRRVQRAKPRKTASKKPDLSKIFEQ